MPPERRAAARCRVGAAAGGLRPQAMEPFFSADSSLPISDFIDFPPKEVIVERLRGVDESAALLPLYETIGERLASRTYERSASAFILIEMLYDFEETAGGD